MHPVKSPINRTLFHCYCSQIRFELSRSGFFTVLLTVYVSAFVLCLI
ncbi:hypothetical protein AALP_AA6G340600 [Arabis alpina]|uniref:Uncharacterized protein n=1 Tax=Arabis alpina TaxID=50452 RepID=A0A087GTH7_ARAAL|nr:hypothetical protein AALP_AA6G340600 [Arabis alpina]